MVWETMTRTERLVAMCAAVYFVVAQFLVVN